MTNEIMSWLWVMAELLPFGLNACEIGSRCYENQPKARDALMHKCRRYVGIDQAAGDGVDVVADGAVYLITQRGSEPTRDASAQSRFDLIVCCEVFEHDPKFWYLLNTMRDELKSGGYLIITTPTICFPEHSYPHDYYRFTQSVYYDVFFGGTTRSDEGFSVIDVRELGQPQSRSICGMARKIVEV